MSLSEQLNQDFKEAYKARDEVRVAVLRLLRTGIKNKEVELRRKLEDKEILGVVSSQVKQRQEAISQFEQGGRPDLVEREKAELAVLEALQPPQLSAAEIEAAAAEIIEEVGARSVKDMGRVMKTFMERYAGRVDGKVVNQAVKEKLSAL